MQQESQDQPITRRDGFFLGGCKGLEACCPIGLFAKVAKVRERLSSIAINSGVLTSDFSNS